MSHSVTHFEIETPIALIWAMAENRVIGIDNKLPWYLPKDLQFFKRCTMGKPVIMGRKTHESIGRPLPGRTNIIVTRDTGYQAEGCRVVHSLAEAFELADQSCLIDGAEEIIVMGGAEIYQQALPYASKLYITRVHADVEGDAWFPEHNLTGWQEVFHEHCQAEGTGEYDYGFYIYSARD
ncbi:dihydrofolate reductase [Oceanospirillum sediminis]|uniref:Dihydrofolate reductase n=1 Tax=Oceanospirillum sediminis TaxID=2760088 RepID=A0A839ITH5_9GAMM|nr:dihydrofolate reductase [Oceanospirillum sediminis]MBB1488251.1 dihydrofolate reductase [Oceanospirillum sediminis]